MVPLPCDAEDMRPVADHVSAVQCKENSKALLTVEQEHRGLHLVAQEAVLTWRDMHASVPTSWLTAPLAFFPSSSDSGTTQSR